VLPVRTHRVVPDQPAEEEAATAEVCSVVCVLCECVRVRV